MKVISRIWRSTATTAAAAVAHAAAPPIAAGAGANSWGLQCVQRAWARNGHGSDVVGCTAVEGCKSKWRSTSITRGRHPTLHRTAHPPPPPTLAISRQGALLHQVGLHFQCRFMHTTQRACQSGGGGGGEKTTGGTGGIPTRADSKGKDGEVPTGDLGVPKQHADWSQHAYKDGQFASREVLPYTKMHAPFMRCLPYYYFFLFSFYRLLYFFFFFFLFFNFFF